MRTYPGGLDELSKPDLWPLTCCHYSPAHPCSEVGVSPSCFCIPPYSHLEVVTQKHNSAQENSIINPLFVACCRNTWFENSSFQNKTNTLWYFTFRKEQKQGCHKGLNKHLSPGVVNGGGVGALYDVTKHRCPTLARKPNLAQSVIISGLQGNTEWSLELARRYYTAHVPLILQIPECSASILADYLL